MRFVTWGKFDMSPGYDLGQPWRMEELGESLSWLVIPLRRPESKLKCMLDAMTSLSVALLMFDFTLSS